MADDLENLYTLFENKINRYYLQFDEEFLPTSALLVVRKYSAHNLVDLELWAFLCSILDYQIKVKNRLIPMLEGLIHELAKRNLYYINLIENPNLAEEILTSYSWGTNQKGLSHRFVKIEHILFLHSILHKMVQKYGSMGKYIEFLYEMGLDEDPNYPMRFILEKFSFFFQKHDPQHFLKGIIPKFAKRPSTRSVMKRMCLFFRWMVRPYPDLEKWTFINKKFLFPPLDQSIQRVFQRAFNIPLRKSINFKDVLAVYNQLRQIYPNDPIKYDFLLSRPAIAGYCNKDPKLNKCYLCPLFSICKNAQSLPDTLHVNPLATKHEQELWERFLRLNQINFEIIETEVPLGNKRADAVCKVKNNGYWVIEVENELNYTAVGQAITYKNLYFQIFGKEAYPVIVCGKINEDILHACQLDVGIKVITV